jgi:hypothetical protein
MSAAAAASPVAHLSATVSDTTSPAEGGSHVVVAAAGVALPRFGGLGSGERIAGGVQNHDGRHDPGATAYQLYLELI